MAEQLKKSFMKIVHPIIEGKLRQFVSEHPSILDGVLWYKKGSTKSKEDIFVDSATKRIIYDLASDLTVSRLRTVFIENTVSNDASQTLERAKDGDIGTTTSDVPVAENFKKTLREQLRQVSNAAFQNGAELLRFEMALTKIGEEATTIEEAKAIAAGAFVKVEYKDIFPPEGQTHVEE